MAARGRQRSSPLQIPSPVTIVQLYMSSTSPAKDSVEITADPSAFLAVVLNEPARARILELSQGAELRAPASLRWEIGNALSAILKRGRMALPEVERALASFSQIPVKLSDVSLASSVRIAAENGVYAYDAYVLECALRHGTPLLSLDARQCEVAERLGIEVLEVA